MHDSNYAELLRKSLRDRLVANAAYLDHFEFADLKLEGSGADEHLVLLFRRSADNGCLWGSRSPRLWTGDDDPGLDWLPLDPHAAVEDYADLIVHRLDTQLWPLHVQTDGPCRPDSSGISWTPWRLGA